MADTAERDVMAYDEAYYLDIANKSSGGSTAQNELMNVGFTSMEESTNPTEVSVQYIGDKSKTNKVTGYDNQFAFETNLIKNNKVVEYINNIFEKRLTGADAEQNLIIVKLWKPVAEGGGTKYEARQIKTATVLDTKSVTPGENINLSGTFKGVGDFVYGKFDTSTKTFTADGAAMSAMQTATMLNSLADTKIK